MLILQTSGVEEESQYKGNGTHRQYQRQSNYVPRGYSGGYEGFRGAHRGGFRGRGGFYRGPMGPPQQYVIPHPDMYDNRLSPAGGRGMRGGGYMAHYYGPPRPAYRVQSTNVDGYINNRRPYYKRYQGVKGQRNSDNKQNVESNHSEQVRF